VILKNFKRLCSNNNIFFIISISYKDPAISVNIRLADKQAGGLILGNQVSKERACLVAYLLVYCLYIVNLVVAVLSNRLLVFLCG
jgi:hypothetical protein